MVRSLTHIQVKISGHLSKPVAIFQGVPQGSVLGPSLFCSLVGDLSCSTGGYPTVQYADDVNIIIGLRSADPLQIRTQVNSVLLLVEKWCTYNKQADVKSG